jgi:beta-glucanase (GH16 family)
LAYAQVGLDSTKWIAYSRAGAPNSSRQCFTPQNVAVSGGNLVLTTKAETATCSSFDIPNRPHSYTSGFVAMRTFNFLYGTVEFRAKFGGGNNSGSWPVAWFQDSSCEPSDPTGTNDNCTGQEVDMAEILDGNFNQVNQQMHIDNFKHNDGCKPRVSDTSQSFHTYQMDWSAGLLVFKVDGSSTCTIKSRFVPNRPMYLKFTAFVGEYGGPVKESTLPWTTLIDYVKVSQASNVIFEDQFNDAPSTQPTKAKEVQKNRKAQ